MRVLITLLITVLAGNILQAQYVYTINADSVKITNHCDTAELIIENHTQNVPGFLYNKGRGRTEFRRALQKLDKYNYLIGADTLALPSNAWIQGGNTFGTTGILGTLDSNHLDIYTYSQARARFTANGNLLIGSNADFNYKLQLAGRGSIYVNPTLSRPGDRIRIGGYYNIDDGQNVLFSTSADSGATYKTVLVERDGYVGLGHSPYSWYVGSPPLRILDNGLISIFSPTLYFGNTGGPYNASALVTSVSNVSEWQENLGNYPSRQNYYYFGTVLQTPEGTNVRAPLKISGRELHWLTGAVDAEAGVITESGNVLLGTTTDNGQKLQVTGTTFSNIFTNSPVPLGTADDGALRLRWGGGGGSYIDFYNQGNTNLRGHIASPADSRPLILWDQVGLSLINTPYLAIGTEPSIGNARFSVLNPEGSGVNTINFARVVNGLMNYDLVASPAGHIILGGGGTDNGNQFQVNGTSYLSDKTGIGTPFPTAQLHTTGSVRFAGLIEDSAISRVVVSDANGNLYYRNLPSWAVNNTFNSSLTVNGAVNAQAVNLKPTRWADYVFDKTYRLPSLAEVENYINQNKHLPGIPSAAEVAQNGVDVGASQADLLKKIEELTLYVIEQQKKLQKQNDEIDALKEQNKELDTLKREMTELKKLVINH